MCASEALREAVKRALSNRTSVSLIAAAHQKCLKCYAQSDQRGGQCGAFDLQVLYLKCMSDYVQKKKDLSTCLRTWKCTLTGLLPGDGDL